MKVEQPGGLATPIFERIASADGDARGLLSAEAAADYSRALGREVRIDEIQPIVNELRAANLIMRKGTDFMASPTRSCSRSGARRRPWGIEASTGSPGSTFGSERTCALVASPGPCSAAQVSKAGWR